MMNKRAITVIVAVAALGSVVLSVLQTAAFSEQLRRPQPRSRMSMPQPKHTQSET
jgi:hypothetical protein